MRENRTKLARWTGRGATLLAAAVMMPSPFALVPPAVAQPTVERTSGGAPRPAYCARIPAPSQSLPGATSFTYRTVRERSLRIHVFAPEEARTDQARKDRRPAMLLFFGGGFRVGDVSSLSDLARAFVAHGYVVALPDYRLLCRDGETAVGGVMDAEAALAWLHGHARDLHIDPRRIALGGGSAGGLLATSAALRVAPRYRPAALVLFNPVLDLETGIPAKDQRPEDAMAYSPSRLPVGALPPTTLFHGTADHTVPIVTSRSFCQRVIADGRVCQLVEYQGMDHSFADSHQPLAYLGGSTFDDTLGRALAFLAPMMENRAK